MKNIIVAIIKFIFKIETLYNKYNNYYMDYRRKVFLKYGVIYNNFLLQLNKLYKDFIFENSNFIFKVNKLYKDFIFQKEKYSKIFASDFEKVNATFLPILKRIKFFFFNDIIILFRSMLSPKVLNYVSKPPKIFIIKQNKNLTWKETVIALSRRQKTQFYAPLQSFWPMFISFSLGLFLIGLIAAFHNEKLIQLQGYFIFIFLISISVGIAFWFSVFFLEKKQGNHNFKILDNIEMGFYLFLFTEALCFLSLFWVFLHSMLAASIHTGLYNPGEGVSHFFINETMKIKENWNLYFFSEIGTPCWYQLSNKFSLSNKKLYTGEIVKVHLNFYDKGQLLDPYKLPLLNTFILLSSAGVLNLSHVYLKKSKFFKSLIFLLGTIFLGIFFVCIQYKEYKECSLQYNDGIYAACFFSLTGLHGIHVILGLFCLFICFLNICFLNYSKNFHQSFHYSILYWHFVDIIWILVYFIIYLWPSSYFFTGDIYSVWLDFGYYSVHFDKNSFEKAMDSKLYSDVCLNNETIYKVIECYHPRSDRWKIRWESPFDDVVHYQLGNMRTVWEDDEPSWEADVLTANAEYFDKTLKFFLKKHPFKIDKLLCEFYLFELHDTKDSFNYNLVKKDPEVFCFVMTMMHDYIFLAIRSPFYKDINNNIKKIIFLMFLLSISKFLSFVYIWFITPYLLDVDYFVDMFNLWEFRDRRRFYNITS